MNNENNNEAFNENPLENKSEQSAEQAPDTNKVQEPVMEQSAQPNVEQNTQQTAEQNTEQNAQPNEQTDAGQGFNSQYIYHNANPQPRNYYTEQKHYIPTGFNNMNGNMNGGMNNQNGAYYTPNQPPMNNQPPKNSKTGLKIFVAIAAAVAVFIAGIGVSNIFNSTNGNRPITSSNGSDDSLKYKGEDIDVNSGNAINRDDIKPDANGKYTADQVAQLVGPSVVNIQVYSSTDSSTGATASGIVLNDKGYIITNDHIYSEVTNAKFIVTMQDGSSYKATYVAGDQRSDIAVLKFDQMPKNLVAATFANSSEIKSGDDVIAIGSPYGLSGTVTKGIVSYPSRRITTSVSKSDGSSSSAYSMRVIQTDVALNSGNSGGALVNMYGQVVGINSSKIAISGYEGLCFAIPSNDAVKYAKSLVKNGVVTNRAKLGITYTTNTSASSLVNNLPAGLVIQEINSESELYSKGITAGENGDIITEINGQKITNNSVALDIIDDSSAGDEVTLKIYSRSTKKEKTYKIKLLEDTSNTSYKNEIPKPSQTTGQDAKDYYKYYESPFSFGD